MPLDESTLITADASLAAAVAGPQVVPETASVVAGATVSGTAGETGTGALAGDSDTNGLALSISAINGGTVGAPLAGLYGELTLNADGSYTYVADNSAAIAAAAAGAHLVETFDYTVTNPRRVTAPSTLTITLDRPPVAGADANAAVVGGAAVGGNVLGNDFDADGDGLIVTTIENVFGAFGAIGAPLAGQYGALTIDSFGNYAYTPNAGISAPLGAHPTDVFYYAESDGQGGTASAQLTITLDRAPVAGADANAAVVGGASVGGNVLGNDFDADGDGLSIIAIENAFGAFGAIGSPLAGQYGALTIDGFGNYAYAPSANINAPLGVHPTDVFYYAESDGQGGTASAQLTIALDRAPVATADANAAIVGGSAVGGNVLGNDSDADGDALSIIAIENAGGAFGAIGSPLAGQYGSLTIDSFGNFVYTPNANINAPISSHPTDVFYYAESDGQGGTASAQLTITLNRAPVAVADASAAVVGGAAVFGNVLGNDGDADGDGLTITAIENAFGAFGAGGVPLAGQYGSLTIDGFGNYSYTPNASISAPMGAHPTDVFYYAESDGNGGTASAQVTITLNRAPVAAADVNIAAVYGKAVSGNVANNDFDPDGDGFAITGITNAANTSVAVGQTLFGQYGFVSIASSGAYTYTPYSIDQKIIPPAGGHAADVFTYTEIDGQGGVTTQTLTIALTPPAPADFNAGGMSGVAFQSADSSLAVWDMTGAAIAGADVLARPGTQWSLIGSGDFYRDDTADLLVQDTRTGQLAFFGVGQDGGGPALDLSQTLQLPANLDPGTSWHAIATGDFNGDGFADIALQNNDSSVSVWEMDGPALAAGGAAILGVPGADWHVRATGDFYGDGTSDLLLQRDDGSLAIWGITQGASGPTLDFSETALLPANLDPGPAWVAKGTGDFNGDGRADIVFQNSQTGDVAIWEMNGASPTGAAVIASPGTAWAVKSVGDYNGDAMSDILLQNSQSGALAIWFMNGLNLGPGSTVLAANPGASWSPVG